MMNVLDNLKIINYLFLVIFFLNFKTVIATTIKIEVKVNDEIITNLDIENEYNYLIALNNSLKNINKNELLEFSKTSLIKEIIKKQELIKIYDLDEKNENIDNEILRIFSNLGLQSIKEIEQYLKNNNLNFDNIYKKILIEILWNKMIYNKYKDKLIVNKSEIQNNLITNNKSKNEYLLYEIVYSIDNKVDISKKYDEIINFIKKNDFETAALKFSLSDTRTKSGEIGWIEESLITEKIKDKLEKLDIGEISKPIIVPNGAMIVKIKDKKKSLNENALNNLVQKAINEEINRQLDIYSNMHFYEIKNKTKIK